MKKILSVLTAVMLFSTACSTGENEPEATISASHAYDYLIFSSLEDFLNAQITAKEGGDIEEFTEDWIAVTGSHEERTLEKAVEGSDFLEIGNIDLPVAIPENFVIRRIEVNYGFVHIYYFPEDVDVSTETFGVVRLENPNYQFSISRLFFENEMDNFLKSENATRDDLIDRKYFFDANYNEFFWEIDGFFVRLCMPSTENENTSADDEISIDDETMSAESITELLRFTETETLNLLDTAEVKAVIERVSRESVRSDIASNGETSDAVLSKEKEQ